jgi:hypothetical protein
MVVLVVVENFVAVVIPAAAAVDYQCRAHYYYWYELTLLGNKKSFQKEPTVAKKLISAVTVAIDTMETVSLSATGNTLTPSHQSSSHNEFFQQSLTSPATTVLHHHHHHIYDWINR